MKLFKKTKKEDVNEEIDRLIQYKNKYKGQYEKAQDRINELEYNIKKFLDKDLLCIHSIPLLKSEVLLSGDEIKGYVCTNLDKIVQNIAIQEVPYGQHYIVGHRYTYSIPLMIRQENNIKKDEESTEIIKYYTTSR